MTLSSHVIIKLTLSGELLIARRTFYSTETRVRLLVCVQVIDGTELLTAALDITLKGKQDIVSYRRV